MLKKNNSGYISKNNLIIKKKSHPKIFISKSKRDLRTDTDYFINSKGKMQLSLNIEQNNNQNIPKKYTISIQQNINNEKANFLNEKSINISNISEFFNRKNKIIKFSHLANKMKINIKEKLNIYNKKPKTPLLLNRNKNIKIFHIRNDRDKLNTNFYLPNQRIIINSDERRKSKKIKERKIHKLNSEKNLRVKYNIPKNINIKKNNSFDILHKNISDINKDNNNTKKIFYIKVNRNFINKKRTSKNNIILNKEDKSKNKNINSIYISKTLENNQKKNENITKINNINKKEQNKKNNEYNIFLDKEYQERFIKKPKIIKIKYDKFNSDNQKKYNTILVKKKIYNINNLTSTISSLSTSNSSQRKKKDWVYRLYNEEINKKKLENKIINSLRKSILINAPLIKQKNEIKIKENSKYDKYGNYKTFNTDNNFINNLINFKGKESNQKRKLCLDKIINNNQRKEVQNKIKINKLVRRYGKKKKKSLYLCNDDLIDEEDEEQEIDKEEN